VTTTDASLNIAFVIYDGFTTLDFIGAYDALTRLKTMHVLPDVRWDVCAPETPVTDQTGLRIEADTIEGSLAPYDLVFVAGGNGSRKLMDDVAFISWIRTAREDALKASVCTGALLLGAAGFLQGRRATTHPNAFAHLAPFCREVVEDERVVDEGDVVTARGVTASIDLGLHLCERIAGIAAAERIRTQMDYPYRYERPAPVTE
jgi:cyclohexyl-isocyanide hydratase